MAKVFVSTFPFGLVDDSPLQLLKGSGHDVQYNPLQRKLTPNEISELAHDCDAIIAGTENLTPLIQKNPNLKMISRVGIGLDSVPLMECKKKNIVVAYTPDAVTMAVAELTVGLIIAVTRKVGFADTQLRAGGWTRPQGKRIGESVIGLVGFGRVGSNVARLISEFHPKEILVNDLRNKQDVVHSLSQRYGLTIRTVEKEEIFQRSDIVSLHVPLSPKTKDLINEDVLGLFKKDCFLVNTSRGGVVNEADLLSSLKKEMIGGAAVDVFEEEPYHGALLEMDNILLTQHMGSCSYDCRAQMERQATEEVLRFLKGEPLLAEVPSEEYEYQET